MYTCKPETERKCVFSFVVDFNLVLVGTLDCSSVLLPVIDSLWVGRDHALKDRLTTRRLTNASVRQRDLRSN